MWPSNFAASKRKASQTIASGSKRLTFRCLCPFRATGKERWPLFVPDINSMLIRPFSTWLLHRRTENSSKTILSKKNPSKQHGLISKSDPPMRTITGSTTGSKWQRLLSGLFTFSDLKMWCRIRGSKSRSFSSLCSAWTQSRVLCLRRALTRFWAWALRKIEFINPVQEVPTKTLKISHANKFPTAKTSTRSFSMCSGTPKTIARTITRHFWISREKRARNQFRKRIISKNWTNSGSRDVKSNWVVSLKKT